MALFFSFHLLAIRLVCTPHVEKLRDFIPTSCVSNNLVSVMVLTSVGETIGQLGKWVCIVVHVAISR
jgi:hypothetical protein